MNILVTGGAGFIGTNTCLAFNKLGHKVFAIDDLSREGSIFNAPILRRAGVVLDIKSILDEKLFSSIDFIFHFAAQTAVTLSYDDPLHDCKINAEGTLKIINMAFRMGVPMVYTSTNKVYGNNIPSFIPVNEDQPVNLETPYGISKGAGDYYMQEYIRHGLAGYVLRMSCIYGKYQNGSVDQGWLSWFQNCIRADRRITIYGDGEQVRDVLYIDDLVRLFIKIADDTDRKLTGVYNVGGGYSNAINLLTAIDKISEKLGKPRENLKIDYSAPRTGDQPYYVSDIRKVTNAFGWRPQIPIDEGIQLLIDNGNPRSLIND